MPAGKTLAANEQALASDIMSMLNYGIAASIPATADVVRDSFYWETDTKILKQEHNGTWVETARGEAVMRLAQLAARAHGDLSDAPEGAHHTKFTTTEHSSIGNSSPHHTKYTDANALAVAISKILMTTRGDIIYRNATVPARLAKGSIGQVLTQGADDPEWATAPGASFVIKASDEQITNSDTLQNDDELLFAATANKTYWVFLWLRMNAHADADFKWLFTVPAGASIKSRASWGTFTGETDATVLDNYLGSNGVDKTLINVYLVEMAGTAGNVQLQWAPRLVTAEVAKVLAGSFIRYELMD